MFSEYLYSPELLSAVRLNPRAFLRTRKLPFPRIIAMMLSGMTSSVQNELNVFAANQANRADLWREVSAQAFSKARRGFSHRVFSLLNQRLFALLERTLVIPRWHGLRLVAADASKLQLTLQDAAGRKVQEAIAFALYLPGPELTLGFSLYSPVVGERQMLFEHLDHLQSDDLLILDRGYPAAWLVAVLNQRKIPFCMRVDALGFAAVRDFQHSGQSDALVQIGAPSQHDANDYDCPRQEQTVRLIRVETPNGNGYVVMTSLLDSNAYPTSAFGDLYHARWRIEEAFKRIKHRLKLEHVTGFSWLAVQQDFGAKILCDNLNALAVIAAQHDAPDCLSPADTEPGDAELDPPDHEKINRTYCFAVLKRQLPRWLTGKLPDIETLNNVLAEIRNQVIKFVRRRSNPRPNRPKPHLYIAYKSFA